MHLFVFVESFPPHSLLGKLVLPVWLLLLILPPFFPQPAMGAGHWCFYKTVLVVQLNSQNSELLKLSFDEWEVREEEDSRVAVACERNGN